jgi:hypothetical protein
MMASLPLIILAWLLFFPIDLSPVTPLTRILVISAWIFLVPSGAAVLSAGRGLRACRTHPERERGRGLAWCSLVVGAAWMFLAFPTMSYSLWQFRHHLRVMTTSAQTGPITHAVTQYAREHGGNYPESLAQLVHLGLLTPSDLVWPYSGTSPARMPSPLPADWRTIELEISAHCDYAYFGSGISSWITDDRKLILLALKPDLAAPEFSIVSASGYGLAWNRGDLATANRDSNLERSKAGAGPVPMSSLAR